MKTPRIKLSHEVPLAVLPVSKTFNGYDYCLPHLLDKEYDYFAYFEEAKKEGRYIDDYSKYNLLLNSSLIGFYLNHISGQWGKGIEKWAALRTKDIEELPIGNIHKLKKVNEIWMFFYILFLIYLFFLNVKQLVLQQL